MAPARTVLFRCDAGQRIGTGHVMRCMTIAERLREAGATCRFACKDHDGHMAALLRGKGYPTDLLSRVPGYDGKGYLKWLGGPVEEDAAQIAALIDRIGPVDLLIVDHYALDARFERLLRDKVRAIAVIEDLPDRVHECDLLLDSNYGHVAEDYAGRISAGARLLVGADYAPVRSDFARLRPEALARRAARERPSRLLIALGGADPDDITSRALAALRPPLDFPQVHVVLSAIARHVEKVKDLAADRPEITVHVDTGRMPELMADADIAVGAAGVSALERCVLGLPTVMVVLAENQIDTAERLDRAGAARSLGGIDAASPERLNAALQEFVARPERMRAMSATAAMLCDGRGLERIVPALLDLMPAAEARPR
ncbi:MAG: UDP-2,4-diacetamido-2,4,6-trideoxy-beta-L-altropyranose hydrolase [Paracoccaceae bacterium]